MRPSPIASKKIRKSLRKGFSALALSQVSHQLFSSLTGRVVYDPPVISISQIQTDLRMSLWSQLKLGDIESM